MAQGSSIRAYEGHRDHQLAQNMKDPFHLPQLAIDPKELLALYSTEYLNVLDPYVDSFRQNLHEECGFEANMTHNPLGSSSIITIKFASVIERDPASVTELPKTSVNVLQRFAATMLCITEVQDEPKSKQEVLVAWNRWNQNLQATA